MYVRHDDRIIWAARHRQKTGGFTSYDEHYQKNETTLKEDALSDRWESRGSKVAVVSKEKADNNDYPEAKEVLLVNNTKNKVIVVRRFLTRLTRQVQQRL